MGTLYSETEDVIIWLGEADWNTDELADVLEGSGLPPPPAGIRDTAIAPSWHEEMLSGDVVRHCHAETLVAQSVNCPRVYPAAKRPNLAMWEKHLPLDEVLRCVRQIATTQAWVGLSSDF
jgi:hypothetical protein